MRGRAGRGHSRSNRDRLQQLNRVCAAKRIISGTPNMKKKKKSSNTQFTMCVFRANRLQCCSVGYSSAGERKIFLRKARIASVICDLRSAICYMLCAIYHL